MWYEAQAALVVAQILTPSYSHALGVWYTHKLGPVLSKNPEYIDIIEMALQIMKLIWHEFLKFSFGKIVIFMNSYVATSIYFC